ncbi:MAG: amidase [Dehalococcoidia bacterium]
MPVRPPSSDALRRAARACQLDFDDADLETMRALITESLAAYAVLDALPEPALPARYPRGGGYRPGRQEDPLGAWYWKSAVRGAEGGPLAGKRVAIKDNVAVAGLPMMNGSALLEGYVPEFDATVVTRILDAGGEITGKAVCEHLCFSGGSHTSDTGPVRNPHDPTRSAGGSSSGSAALVVAGEVDLAIGGDQGGSIRMPASFAGCYGLKPTYGLVPYTGVFPIELTLDHVGPMGANVADVALLLEVIAGDDGLDPRQRGVRTEPYVAALTGDIHGLRIGVVEDGFDLPGVSEPDVDAAVYEAARRLADLGADVRSVAIPLHRAGGAIGFAICVEGATDLMVRGNGGGTNWKGHYGASMFEAFARGRRARPNDLAPTVKLVALMGHYLQEAYQGRTYAKAQNLARTLTAAYDEAFRDVDLLLMPTTPMKATPLPAPDAGVAEIIRRAWEPLPNTMPFDVSGHPAVSVPCAMSGGLPVGMMLVGRRWEDATVLRAAHAYEQTGAYHVRPVAAAAV